MDMDQAAVWLAGSILTTLGFVVVIMGIVVVNNILHKYWKPIQLFRWTDQPIPRFMTDEEAARIAPHLEERTK
jgi:hypothetical protein